MMYTVTINGLINFMCKWKYSLLNIVSEQNVLKHVPSSKHIIYQILVARIKIN